MSRSEAYELLVATPAFLAAALLIFVVDAVFALIGEELE